MAADSLARLIVTLEAQTATYQKGLESANRKLSAFKSTQQKTLSTLESGFKRFGASIAAFLSIQAVQGLNNFIKQQVDAADAIGEAADAAGLGTEQMQRLVFAFTQITTATKEGATKGLTAFNAQLGKAREGSKQLQETAAQLGVDLTQNTNVAIEQAFIGLSKIEDGARRAALAGEFFTGRFGKQLAGALDGTTEALDRATAAATGIADEKTIKRLSDLNDTLQRLSGITDKATSEAIAANADSYEKLATALSHVEVGAVKALAGLVDLVTQPQSFWDTLQMMWNPQVQPPLKLGTNTGPGSGGGFSGNGRLMGPPRSLFAGGGPNTVTKPTDNAAVAKAAQAEKERLQRLLDLNSLYYEEARQMGEAYDEGLAKHKAEVLQQDIEKSDAIIALFKANTEKLNAQADAFGNLFADNLVQAADSGFASVLESWTRTLEQMVLVAAGKQLFKSIFGNAAEGSLLAEIGSIFGGGKAAGGPVSAGTPYLVGERGPEMFIPGSSGRIQANGGARGLSIVQNVSVGAGASRAEVAAAMSVAKNQAIIEIRDQMRRGR